MAYEGYGTSAGDYERTVRQGVGTLPGDAGRRTTSGSDRQQCVAGRIILRHYRSTLAADEPARSSSAGRGLRIMG